MKNISTNDCWLFAGYIQKENGYGYIHTLTNGKQKNHPIHRVMYENYVGSIPNGLVIDHLCRVHQCCNPLHLEVVTIAENVLRGNGIAANRKRQTHCKKGHEFTLENTRLRGKYRTCRACDKEYAIMRYRKSLRVE